MRKKFWLIFFVVIFCSDANVFYGNEKRLTWLFGNPDTLYLESINHTLGLKLYYANKYSTFDIMGNNFDKRLQYVANSDNSIGIGVIYSFLDVNFGYSRNFFGSSERGNSKKFDFQTQMYLPTTTWRIFINKYKGFYLHNADDIIANWHNSDDYYIRDDIEAYSVRASVNYFFNHSQYSNKILFAHQALQKKTAGSFLVGLSLDFSGVSSDSSFVPSAITDTSLFNLNVDRSSYWSVGVTGGYAINFAIRNHWFIGGMLAPGLSFARNNQAAGNVEQTDNSLNIYLQTEFGFGYNSRRLYAGLHRKQDLMRTPIGNEHNSLSLRNGKVYLMVVYRFKVRSIFNMFD